MRPKRQLLKRLGGPAALLLVTLIVTSCAGTGLAAPLDNGEIAICHATGDPSAPYEKLTLSYDELLAHARHRDDLILPPGGECPQELQPGANTGKIAICHATGSQANPYEAITIDFNGLNGHAAHAGDIIPAPADGCSLVTPTPEASGTPTSTPTPGPSPTPTATGTPSATPTPAASPTGDSAGTITICHATGSAKNPYVLITVSLNGLNGHGKHARDIIPAPAGGCPKE